MTNPSAQREARIMAARSPGGGWTRDVLAGWGVPWPPAKGWKERLINESFPDPSRSATPTPEITPEVGS